MLPLDFPPPPPPAFLAAVVRAAPAQCRGRRSAGQCLQLTERGGTGRAAGPGKGSGPHRAGFRPPAAQVRPDGRGDPVR